MDDPQITQVSVDKKMMHYGGAVLEQFYDRIVFANR